MIWDLQTGTPIAVSDGTVPADTPYSTLVPAQSYSWGPGGALVPGSPFIVDTASQPIGLVGNPIGFTPFGPWQPGTITVFGFRANNGQGPFTELYLYETTFAAWSPDGRYFADGLKVRGLVVPAGSSLPPPTVLSGLQEDLQKVAALPFRDAALAQALAHDLLSGYSDIPVSIAWRADGKVLAELNQHNGYNVRATDTGRVVKSVGVMQLPAGQVLLFGYPGSWFSPLWSPDGKWLLLPTLALVNTSHLGV
jgi:hypothetical protein